jgi:hypothetical protein
LQSAPGIEKFSTGICATGTAIEVVNRCRI